MTLIPTDLDHPRGVADVPENPDERRDWLAIGVGLVGLAAILAICLSVASLAGAGSDDGGSATAASPAASAAAPAAATDPADAPAPTIAEAEGVDFEPFQLVDPTLPAVPAGAVTRFTVDVDQHDVQVAAELAPTEAWTYTSASRAARRTWRSSMPRSPT